MSNRIFISAILLMVLIVLFSFACIVDEGDGEKVAGESAVDDFQDDDTEDDDDSTDDDSTNDDDDNDDNNDDECNLLYPNLKITAHRGATLQAPENTIPAIEKAFELGAHAVEIDVRHTADGHFVLMHDDTVDRTTNGTGLVSDFTLTEIKELNIRNLLTGWMYPDLKVPTLEEALIVIDAYDGEADLDMKTDEVEGAIQAVVDLGLEHRCFVYSGSIWKHEAVRSVSADVRIQPTSSSVQDTQDLLDYFDPDPEHIEIDGESGFSPANIDLIHSAGSIAFMDALGVRDVLAALGFKQAWGSMMEGGLDIIQTDLPGPFVDYWQSICE